MQTEARVGVAVEGGGGARNTKQPNAPVEQQPPRIGTALQLLAGGLAGALDKTFTAPLARLTILLQLEGMLRADVAKRTSVWGEASRIAREEGARAFWKGNLSSTACLVPLLTSTPTITTRRQRSRPTFQRPIFTNIPKTHIYTKGEGGKIYFFNSRGTTSNYDIGRDLRLYGGRYSWWRSPSAFGWGRRSPSAFGWGRRSRQRLLRTRWILLERALLRRPTFYITVVFGMRYEQLGAKRVSLASTRDLVRRYWVLVQSYQSASQYTRHCDLFGNPAGPMIPLLL